MANKNTTNKGDHKDEDSIEQKADAQAQTDAQSDDLRKVLSRIGDLARSVADNHVDTKRLMFNTVHEI